MAYYEIERFRAGKFGKVYFFDGPLNEGSIFSGKVHNQETKFTLQRGEAWLNGQPVSGAPVVFDPLDDFGRRRRVLVDLSRDRVPVRRNDHRDQKQVAEIYKETLEASGIKDTEASFLHQIAYCAIALIRR